MKIFVKTLKGTHFEIEVSPKATVTGVKYYIETFQGKDVYPAAQQMLIHGGKVLKDGTTLEENEVAENSFIVIMLTKSKSSSGEGSTSSTAHATQAPRISAPTPTSIPWLAAYQPPVVTLTPPAFVQFPAPAASPDFRLQETISPLLFNTPVTYFPSPAPVAAPYITSGSHVYGQAASNLVAGFSNLEGTIQHIISIGRGTWDRNTVTHALHAAYNNPQRALDYLNYGLHNMGSNAAGASTLDIFRNRQQFQDLQPMVQTDPQFLQPMPWNPMRLFQGHQNDSLNLINEPVEGGQRNILRQLDPVVPQAAMVTHEQREAIRRLEAMGFGRAKVLEAFFACNKNEELATNYLLDHIREFDDYC